MNEELVKQRASELLRLRMPIMAGCDITPQLVADFGEAITLLLEAILSPEEMLAIAESK